MSATSGTTGSAENSTQEGNLPGSSLTRAASIRQVISDLELRHQRGEDLQSTAVLSAHPSLLPELAVELHAMEMIRKASLYAGRAGAITDDLAPMSDTHLDAPVEPIGGLAGSDLDERKPSICGYRLTSEISRGGQATVFAGIQESTGQKVAVKVLAGGSLLNARARSRFEREVQALANLNNAHVVGIVDCGRTSDGAFYLIMNFVEGCPLDAYAKDLAAANPDDPSRILRLFITLARAMDDVHRHGIVHRDLKPSNVLVDHHGEPHILDFGLARLLSAEREDVRTVTTTGQILGSLPWSSPEQAAGAAAVDAPSDVYSLGVMLYQSLTGVFPYEVVGPVHEVLRRILKVVPKPPSRCGTKLSGLMGRFTDAVVMKALTKSVSDRYQSAAEFAQDLEFLLQGLRPVAQPFRVRSRWRPWIAVFIVLAAVAGVARSSRPVPRTHHVVQMPLPQYRNSLGMILVRIPAGSSWMGSQPREAAHAREEHWHLGKVDRAFFLGVTEVTRGQYSAVMDVPGGLVTGSEAALPVANVSWDDAQEFCRRLSAREQRRYRLPTEVEWEYACRAGKGSTYSGTGELESMGWYRDNSGGRPHAVASQSFNEWGLYDMHGNVDEWCANDFYLAYEPDYGETTRPDLRLCVTKGGSFKSSPEDCRSASRHGFLPDASWPTLGFRVALDP